MLNIEVCEGFDSLQSGRHIQTVLIDAGVRNVAKFRFPSNGKAHLDDPAIDQASDFFTFRFPSNGKAHSDTGPNLKNGLNGFWSFDSLQTGKHIAS